MQISAGIVPAVACWPECHTTSPTPIPETPSPTSVTLPTAAYPGWNGYWIHCSMKPPVV
jgi:hypothetical protein